MTGSSPTSEQAYAALFTLLTTSSLAPTWATSSRRVKLWKDVPPSGQPALFQSEHAEEYVDKPRGIPQRVTLFASLIIYLTSGDPNAVMTTLVNNMIQQVKNCLAPTDMIYNVQTLGGIVSHCWIEGRIFKDPGDLDGQAMIVIPVRILIP